MKKTEANIVGNNLVVSLPNAVMPGLWRTDCTKLKDALFFIEEKDGNFLLKVREGSKKGQEISVFEVKEKAVEALDAINTAFLSGGEAPMLAAKTFQKPQGQEKQPRVFKRLIQVVLVLFIAFVILSVIKPRTQNKMQSQTQNKMMLGSQKSLSPLEQNNSKTPKTNLQSGVPLSADDFFGE